MLTTEQKKTLKVARQTYGPKNQLTVSAEECIELAVALLKFIRYSDYTKGIEATRESVLEERADVEIILDHIDNLYGFNLEEIQRVVQGKIERLERWLDTTDDMEYTTIDRTVGKTKDTGGRKTISVSNEFDRDKGFDCCEGCFYYDPSEKIRYITGACIRCKNRRD